MDLSDLPNGQWYYTYDNLIRGMAQLKEFANEGDENTKKLEIAAFLANIAQETGAKAPGDPYGGPGCFIQEGSGAFWGSDAYSQNCKLDDSCAPAGYCGRGPHQLSWDYNYKAFGETMDVGDDYLNDPDLLTKDPKIGIAGSIWFWGHTDWGSNLDIPFKPSAHDVVVGKWEPTNSSTPGVRPEYNDVACGRTEPNFGVIINIINGGIECGPNARNPDAAKNRVKYLEAIAEAMGVTIPDGFLDDCSSQKPFNPCFSY
ncbi:MAG: chitinase [Pseudomonadota bacterium]